MLNPRAVQNALDAKQPSPLEILTTQVLSLLRTADENDEVVQEYAVQETVKLLKTVSTLYLEPIPLAAVLPSYEGGVRIDWLYPDFSLTLVMPPNESQMGYIFYEHGTTFGTEPVSVEGLVRRLWIGDKINNKSEL